MRPYSAIQSILDDLVPYDATVLCLKARDFSRTGYLPRILAPRASKFLKWMHPRSEAPLMHASPGTRLCQLSDVVFDPRQLHHAEFFRRYMAPAQWHHIACLLFWDQTQLTSEVVIMRTAAQGASTTTRSRHSIVSTHTSKRPCTVSSDGWPGGLRETGQGSGNVRSIGTLPRATTTRMDLNRAERELLTPAESQLVHLLHAGLSNKEIATRLHKSVRTVKTQLTSIYRKYGVRSRTRLLATLNGSTEHP